MGDDKVGIYRLFGIANFLVLLYFFTFLCFVVFCSCASYMGHFDMLNYFSVAENETKARVRFSCMERMLQPCGPPPERMED